MRRHSDWVEAFRRYRNCHRGQKVIVCGTGPSIRAFNPPPHIPTIGVNTIGEYFDPTYLLVLDSPRSFRDGTLDIVLRTRPKVTTFVPDWTAKEWEKAGLKFTKYSAVKVKKTGPRVWEDPHTGLPQVHFYGAGATYAGLSLAGYMGGRRIGLIGVDLGGHDAFRERTEEMCRVYGELRDLLRERGTKVFNLSAHSVLTNLSPMDLGAFCGSDTAVALGGRASGSPCSGA